MLGHELAEALLVILGGNDGGGGVLRDDQGRLDPRLQLLVPRVLTQIVDDPEHNLLSLLVHSHQQRVIHDVYRLKRSQRDIEPLNIFKHVKRGKREEEREREMLGAHGEEGGVVPDGALKMALALASEVKRRETHVLDEVLVQ